MKLSIAFFLAVIGNKIFILFNYWIKFASFLALFIESTVSFSKSNKFIHFINLPNTNDVCFYYYTEDSNFPKKLDSLKILDPKKKTVYLIHGWTESYKASWYKDIAMEYLKNKNYQVVCVDWSNLSSKAYNSCVLYTKFIGLVIGSQICELVRKYKFSPKKIELVGFSLGAQIAGYAGKKFYEEMDKKIHKITGLDPAGPVYKLLPDFDRLCRYDAKFVHVIHTNAGILGIKEPLGHVDCYINGGSLQPECSEEMKNAKDFMNMHKCKFDLVCLF